MIGLILAVLLFNIVAFYANKILTHKQIAHIWMFTVAFQASFDVYIDIKYHGYWYFAKEVTWSSLPGHTILLPALNILFINWYPFEGTLGKKIRYYIYWVIFALFYEVISMLPEPWGYFHYGWWTLWHSAILDPILFFTLHMYYKKFVK